MFHLATRSSSDGALRDLISFHDGGTMGIHTASQPVNGLLQIGAFEAGDSASYNFKRDWFALNGGEGDRYPSIFFADNNTTLRF
jgi:hypothetical protein